MNQQIRDRLTSAYHQYKYQLFGVIEKQGGILRDGFILEDIDSATTLLEWIIVLEVAWRLSGDGFPLDILVDHIRYSARLVGAGEPLISYWLEKFEAAYKGYSDWPDD